MFTVFLLALLAVERQWTSPDRRNAIRDARAVRRGRVGENLVEATNRLDPNGKLVDLIWSCGNPCKTHGLVDLLIHTLQSMVGQVLARNPRPKSTGDQ